MKQDEIFLIRTARTKEHQLALDKSTTERLSGMQTALNNTYNEIYSEMASGAKKTPFNRGRGVALLDEIYGLTGELQKKLAGEIAITAGVASSESAIAHSKIFGFDGAIPDVSSVALSASVMAAYWNETPVGGKLLNDWVNKTFDVHTVQKIKQEVFTGMLKAESYGDIAKRLKKGVDKSMYELTTLTKTYVQSANIDALNKVYEANKDMVTKVRWVATFEGGGKTGMGTCAHCAWLDGQVFKRGDAPRCPFHPRCRCTLAPVTKGDLGLSDKDIEKVGRPYQIWKDGTVKRGNKKLLEAGRFQGSFEDWLMKQPGHVMRNTVGPGRYNLIKSGKIVFKDLIDPKTLRLRRLDEFPAYLKAKKAARHRG